jgi:hypothetical protein
MRIFLGLLLFYSSCSAGTALIRVNTPIGRPIAQVTANNPTPNYRWSLSIAHRPDGTEWIPANCSQAREEVKLMVPAEYMIALKHSVESAPNWARDPARTQKTAGTIALLEYIERDLSTLYPEEGGFIDAIEAKIERSWVHQNGSDRQKLVESCKAEFGAENEQLWYSLILSAARDSK